MDPTEPALSKREEEYDGPAAAADEETVSWQSSSEATDPLPSSEEESETSPGSSDKLTTEAEEMGPVPGKKTVLVTGGAGFIGSHVAEYLLTRGDDVIIVDELNSYYDVRIKNNNLRQLRTRWGEDRMRVYVGDCADAAFISDVFVREKPRWVVHLAARAGVRPSIDDPFIYVHSNIDATTRLLELARVHGNDNFVFASSSSVYGGSKNSLFSESDLVDEPVSPYAATKKACELMAFTYHHLYGLNVAGLRFFTVYGPRGRPDMAPFKFVDRVSRGAELQQFGDGTSSRDYTYISDIVDGVVRSLDRPLGYQIFNLGNGNPVALREFIEIVEEATGRPAKIKIMPEQPGDVPRTAANIQKARDMLGYDPKVSFRDGIHRLAAWYGDEYQRLNEEPEVCTTINAKSVESKPDLTIMMGAHGEAGCL